MSSVDPATATAVRRAHGGIPGGLVLFQLGSLAWELLAVIGPIADAAGPVASALVFPLLVSGIPVAIGVAVLKYRLYDIDHIINRTLAYGLLTALLGAVYAGIVLVLGRCLVASATSHRPGQSLALPWPPPPCSSRRAVAFRPR